ncbi:MAG: 30S ribosomal protein S20 [Bacilli bacterium]|nr:30S ribosomal protein S20 [Bacilli bacterium]MDD4407986.1 30S ribosomal protein S20 [Bacilli bacterium]
MPNIKSAKKSVKTTAIISSKNKIYTSRIKNSIKKIETAVKNKDKEAANDELKHAIQYIDKAASKGLIKQNTCDRQKSRLNKKVKEM